MSAPVWLQRLHGWRIWASQDPAGFIDAMPSGPLRSLGLGKLVLLTWMSARLGWPVRPYWLTVEAADRPALAVAFDAAGDCLAAAEAAPGQPGVLRLRAPAARLDVHGYGGAASTTAAPWEPWAIYRAWRRGGAGRGAALTAAWPGKGRRFLPGGARPFAPPTPGVYRAWLAGVALPEDTGPMPADLVLPPLGPGDRLVEGAAAALKDAFADPATTMVYADEDRADADGQPRDPVFKTSFDAERLKTQDYIGTAFAVRASALTGADGRLDAPSLAGRLPRGSIRHLPLPLWRRSAAPVWRVAGERPRLPSPPPRVLIIVPTRDRPRLLRACAAGLLERTAYPGLELRVVDNGSTDPQTLALLAELDQRPNVGVLRIDGPFDYPALNNAAAAGSDAEVLAFLNDDTWVIAPDWLDAMVALAVQPEAGAVGAKLFYPDGRIQHAGVALGLGPPGVAGHPFRGAPSSLDGPQAMLRTTREVSAVTGACLVVERRKFAAVGGFDPSFKVAYNDVDLCLRLGDRGWRSVWTPHAQLVHIEGASRGADASPEKGARLADEAARMRDRWGDRLASDPYYHPALYLEGERWALGPTLRSAAPR